MGCALNKFHNHLTDLSKRTSTIAGAITINAQNLHTYLSRDNPNPKCIFIFGGSGSSKGEFIWEMLQQSCENYLQNEDNEAAKLLIKKKDLKLNTLKFAYHYIDVEKLIVDNLDQRVKKLCTTPQSNSNHFINNYVEGGEHSYHPSDHLIVESPDFFENRISKRRRSNVSEELKTQLLLYSNIVTNSWILSLIKKAIEDNNFGPNEKIFIINLIPNRVTLFKDCLFLKQTPSFGNFNFNYIAVNLVKHIDRRKDLGIKLDELHDEINCNFINYFRLIGKMIDVRVEESFGKLEFKLTSSKDAIKIENMEQLLSFIYMPKKDQLELNIFNFKFDSILPILESAKKSALTFVINNKMELDEGVVLKLQEKNINLLHVRKFIQVYKLTRYSLNFV